MLNKGRNEHRNKHKPNEHQCGNRTEPQDYPPGRLDDANENVYFTVKNSSV